MLALLVPGVGMGGGPGVTASPIAARSVWLTYENSLSALLRYEDHLSLTLTYENTLALTLADQSHAC